MSKVCLCRGAGGCRGGRCKCNIELLIEKNK